MAKYSYNALLSVIHQLGINYIARTQEKSLLIQGWHDYFMLHMNLDGSKKKFYNAIQSALKIAFHLKYEKQLADVCSTFCESGSENLECKVLFGSKDMITLQNINQYSKELIFLTEQEKIDFIAKCNETNFGANFLQKMGISLPYRDILSYDYISCMYEDKCAKRSVFLAFARYKDVFIGNKKKRFFVFKEDVWNAS